MSVFKKVGEFLGLSDDYEEDYEYGIDDVIGHPDEMAPKRSKVVSLHNGKNMKIAIHEPKSYDDAPSIIDDVKMRKAVIINFEGLEIGLKKQIFDFMNGGLYAVEGKIQKVTKDIFIMAPNTIEIEGLKEELKNTGSFPW